MSEAPYDLSVLEGNNDCDPVCLNGGVCQNENCFCESPYAGIDCSEELEVTTRIDIFVFILLCLAAIIVGFISVFLVKFIYDCFYTEPEDEVSESEDEDEKNKHDIYDMT